MKSSWSHLGGGGGDKHAGGGGGVGEGTRDGGGVAVTTGVAPSKSRQSKPLSSINSSRIYPSRVCADKDVSGSSKSGGDTVANTGEILAEGPFIPTSAKSIAEESTDEILLETKRTHGRRTPQFLESRSTLAGC
jgi:hypothetical protein